MHYKVSGHLQKSNIFHHTIEPLHPLRTPQPLSSLVTTNLFSLSMSLFFSLESTYEWNDTLFVILHLIYFT